MQLPDRGLSLWAGSGLLVTGDVVWYPQCPAAYVTPFSGLMLTWYLWLAEWGKTPVDTGLVDARDLDPRYWPAMSILKRESSRIEREELDRIRTER